MFRHHRRYTSNFKISAKREEESNPPPAEERQTTHQSPLTGGSRNNGANSSPSFSLEFRSSTLRVPPFWSPEGRHFADDKLEHRVPEELGSFSKEFYATGISLLTESLKTLG